MISVKLEIAKLPSFHTYYISNEKEYEQYNKHPATYLEYKKYISTIDHNIVPYNSKIHQNILTLLWHMDADHKYLYNAISDSTNQNFLFKRVISVCYIYSYGSRAFYSKTTSEKIVYSLIAGVELASLVKDLYNYELPNGVVKKTIETFLKTTLGELLVVTGEFIPVFGVILTLITDNMNHTPFALEIFDIITCIVILVATALEAPIVGVIAGVFYIIHTIWSDIIEADKKRRERDNYISKLSSHHEDILDRLFYNSYWCKEAHLFIL